MRIIEIVAAMALVVAGGDTPSSPPESRDVEIVGLDYAFKIPAKVASGRTTFRFSNKGKVAHELNISLLKKGASVQQFIDSARADGPTGAFREGPVGVLF